MHDVTIWLLVANALVVAAAVAYRGMVHASLVPVRVPARLARCEQNRSR
jgi:hypothetical protein